MYADEKSKKAWNEYAEALYKRLSNHSNFKGAFLTWEDFLMVFSICDLKDPEERLRFAKFVGYQTWVEQNFSLKDYNKKFAQKYDSYGDIRIPGRDDPDMEAMYEFADGFLNTILSDTQKVFPNISMEVRLDWDPYKSKGGSVEFYKHNATYACGSSDFTATMYGIPMGCENKGERITAKDAMGHTEYILKNLSRSNSGKPVYIEQFLFMDNTPTFSHNAQIKPEEVGGYLRGISRILKEYAAGYGIWAYRNYRNNLIYNPGFALEGKGWKNIGNPGWSMIAGSNACHLEGGQGIEQRVPPVRLQHLFNDTCHVTFDVVQCEQEGKISVSVGGHAQEAIVGGAGKIDLVFDKKDISNLKIEVLSGNFCIDNVCLYSFVQNGGMYDEAGNELEYVNDVRKLNEDLQ